MIFNSLLLPISEPFGQNRVWGHARAVPAGSELVSGLIHHLRDGTGYQHGKNRVTHTEILRPTMSKTSRLRGNWTLVTCKRDHFKSTSLLLVDL